jgi:hypothetical protein
MCTLVHRYMKNVHEVRKVRRMRTGEFVRNLCAPAPPLVSHFAVVRMCLCADGEVEPRAAVGRRTFVQLHNRLLLPPRGCGGAAARQRKRGVKVSKSEHVNVWLNP